MSTVDSVSSGRKQRTRVRILDAANRLLLERGYHGVGLETVAHEAGVTRQTVYDQFGSKSGLLGAMIARQEEQAGLSQVLQTVMSQIDGLAMLRAMLDAIVTVEPKVYPYSRLVYAARIDDPVAAQMWNARLSSRRAGMGVVFARLASDGRLRPGIGLDEGADVAWAIASPHQYEYLVVERGWSIEHYREHLETTITERLLAPAVGDSVREPKTRQDLATRARTGRGRRRSTQAP